MAFSPDFVSNGALKGSNPSGTYFPVGSLSNNPLLSPLPPVPLNNASLNVTQPVISPSRKVVPHPGVSESIFKNADAFSPYDAEIIPAFAATKPEPKKEDSNDIALFGSKRSYELWKSTEHVFSYMVGNSLGSVAHYYYRVVNSDLKDIFLYDQNNVIGRAASSVLVPSAMRDNLTDSATNLFLTQRANEFDNVSSGIKLVFQIPNLLMNGLMTYRNTEDRPLRMASAGNLFRSSGYLMEKSAIILAGYLYNQGHASLNLPLGFQIDSLDLLTMANVSIILGSLIATPLGFPFIINQAKKEGGVGGIFMESLNALGASAGNIIMSGATLYLYAQSVNNGSDYDSLYKVLKQSFEFKDTLLYVNMGIMLLVSGLSMVGHLQRYRRAIKENDTERKLITAPLIASSLFGLAAAVFIANPATLPLGLGLYVFSSVGFISSMLIKHRQYLGNAVATRILPTGLTISSP